MNKKVMRHKAICDELNSLYERKNHDYGDSNGRRNLQTKVASHTIDVSRHLAGRRHNDRACICGLPNQKCGFARLSS